VETLANAFQTQTPSQDVLLKCLQENSGLSVNRIKAWTSNIIGLDHFRRCNHCGGSVEPNQKYYERNGKEHTFRDVALDYLVEELESIIRREVAKDIRSDVYRKVLVGCPGNTEIPEWDKEPLNPNGKPLAPFSVRSQGEYFCPGS
jgi:hypothetical protein